MNRQTFDRLFGVKYALDSGVVRVSILAIACAFIIAPIAFISLRKAGKIPDKQSDELWKRYKCPNKTLGGSLGALLLTTALAALVGHFVFRYTPIDQPARLILLGVIISASGQLGDLLISSLKRDLDIKDMGLLFPGHGGWLDRFDSLLLTAPAVFHYVGYFRGIGLDQPTRVLSGS